MDTVPSCSSNSPTIKRLKCAALSRNEKIIILNVYNTLRYQYPITDYSVRQIVDKCANMTGIGKSTIFRIVKEQKDNGDLSEPKKKPGRKAAVVKNKNANALVFKEEKQMCEIDYDIDIVEDPLLIKGESNDSSSILDISVKEQNDNGEISEVEKKSVVVENKNAVAHVIKEENLIWELENNIETIDPLLMKTDINYSSMYNIGVNEQKGNDNLSESKKKSCRKAEIVENEITIPHVIKEEKPLSWELNENIEMVVEPLLITGNEIDSLPNDISKEEKT